MPRIDYALTPSQRADARAALALLDGTEMTLEEAARRAIVGRRAGKRYLFPEAVDLLIRNRISERARQGTIDWYMSKLAPFVSLWEQRGIDMVSRAEIRDAVEAQPVGSTTKAHYSRALRALWRFCAAQEPPLTGADVTHGLRTTGPRKDSATSGTVAFLSVDDVATVLAKIDPKYRDGLATMLFAGLRPGEIKEKHKAPLLYRHVNTVEKFIRVPREVSKTDKPRLIQGLPPTLWAWFSRPARGSADRSDQPLCPVYAIQLHRRAAAILGRPLPHDCFRHTFITYAVALIGSADTVSIWIGHEGRTSLIFNTYMGLVMKSEAVKFWALRPAV